MPAEAIYLSFIKLDYQDKFGLYSNLYMYICIYGYENAFLIHNVLTMPQA